MSRSLILLAALLLWPALAGAYDGPTPEVLVPPQKAAFQVICDPDPTSPTTGLIWVSRDRKHVVAQCFRGTIEANPERMLSMWSFEPWRQWQSALGVGAPDEGVLATLYISRWTRKSWLDGTGYVGDGGTWAP